MSEATQVHVSTVTRFETHAQVTARKARELFNALKAQGFTDDQATDLVGASIIGHDDQ